jgi:hypothetical protein
MKDKTFLLGSCGQNIVVIKTRAPSSKIFPPQAIAVYSLKLKKGYRYLFSKLKFRVGQFYPFGYNQSW